MKSFWQTHKKPLSFAIVLHVLLLVALCLNWQWQQANAPALQAGPIVQATLIEQPSTTKTPPQPIVKPTPPQPKAEPVKVEKPLPEPIKEQVKPVIEKPVVEKPIEKPAEVAIAKPKPKAKPKPDLKKQMENDLAAALNQEQKDMHKQKQAQQRAKQRNDLEKQLQQQLAADAPATATNKTEVAAAPSTMSSGEIDKYRALILAAIGQHWIVPPDVSDKSCQFLIHVAPGGVVLDVKLLQSSGDPAMDRSARAAVFKASPLPVPTDSASFNAFRELNLTVHPKSTES